MYWTLPLAAISEITGFTRSNIKSDNHYQSATDTISSIWPWKAYKSSPHTPPHMTINRHRGKLSDGYVFFSPSDQKDELGTYELSGTGFIMTQDGDLVFAGEETGYGFCDEWIAGMTDFRPQEYNGKQYITYWNGCNTKGAHWGHRWGRVTFIDEEYTNFTINPDLKVNTLDEANKGQIDMHDHQMTERNTMVVTTYNNIQYDLTSIGGESDMWVADSMFVEIDVETQEVLFEWKALDHTKLEDSRWGLGKNKGTEHLPWDWFHINAVQVIGDNYLISSRHHWAVYLISGKDGSVIWKLDGQDGGDFGSIPSRFRWQHHARAQNVSEDGMTVSLFNNHVNGPRNRRTASQGLAFFVPMPASPKNPPQLVRLLETPRNLVFGATQGSYQMDLGNGNGFVGYGKAPVMREFGPNADGTDLRWEGRFGHDDAAMSYRAFKSEWHGTPKNWDPVIFIEEVQLQRSRTPRAYVSWNGATDISGWAVYAGEDEENLKSIGIAKKQGFETVFDLDVANCVQVGAIRNDTIIRGSNIACLGSANGSSNSAVGYTLDTPANEEPDKAPVDDSNEEPDKVPVDEPVPVDTSEIDELQAEKDKLEAEIAELQEEQDDLKSDTWASYRLFGEVAAAVILLVAGTWGYVLWRDWRRRRQYQGVLGSDPYSQQNRFSSGVGLNVFNFGRSHQTAPDRLAESAMEFDESKSDDDESGGRNRKEIADENFSLTDSDADDSDAYGSGSSSLNARTPFMRVSSAGV